MRPLALWATPRTVSTAFDKMVRARGDHAVLTEPFSVPFYDGPEQRSPRYPISEPSAAFDATLEQVLAAPAPVFVKDMAYQLGPLLRSEVLARFTSSFLIRDPAWAIPSLLRVWPDATVEEAGYHAQLRAFELCCELEGRPPVVLDSDALRADPAAEVGRWCDAVGIDRRPDALRWSPGRPPGWERWSEWFDAAAASTGFAPPPTGPPPKATGRAAELIDACRPVYDVLVRAS